MTPLAPESAPLRFTMIIPVDPFDRAGPREDNLGVAREIGAGTVSARSAPGRSLTAILIADERRIAVIDDVTVKVGDVLRDGARVATIQADRVWISERDGRMRMLTLGTREQ